MSCTAKIIRTFCLVVIAVIATYFQFGCSSSLSSSSMRVSSIDSAIPDSVARQIAQDHYLSGTLAEEMEEYYEAAYEYQIALLYDPSSATVAIALATIYAKLDMEGLDDAIILLGNSLKINPDNERLLKLYAHFCFSMEYFDKAFNGYKALSRVRPLLEYEQMRLARLALQFDRVDEALHAYNDYLDRFGLDAEVLNRIGHIYLVIGSIDQADSVLRKSIELDPNQGATFFILGGIAVSREDWTDAEQFFINAVANDSSNVRYWTNLMFALGEQNKYDKMVAVTERAIDIFPSIPQFYDMRGSALEQLDRLDEALAVTNKSIAIDSSRMGVYLTKGFIHHRREEWLEGAKAYEKALSLEPDNPLVLNNYAYMLSIQKYRLEDALNMVNRAIAIQPDTPSFLDTRGWLYYLLKYNEKALIDIKKAIKQDSLTAEIYYHLGYVYEALNNVSSARKAWEKALELDPNNEEYKYLLLKND